MQAPQQLLARHRSISSGLALISSLDTGLLSSPGFAAAAAAALMQATHQAAVLLLVVQTIPPEPPLVLVAPLLKLMQVTHQVLVGGSPAEADPGHSSSPGSAAGWCPVVAPSNY